MNFVLVVMHPSLANLMGGTHAFHSRKQSISHMGFSIQKARNHKLATRSELCFACVLYVQLSASKSHQYLKIRLHRNCGFMAFLSGKITNLATPGMYGSKLLAPGLACITLQQKLVSKECLQWLIWEVTDGEMGKAGKPGQECVLELATAKSD